MRRTAGLTLTALGAFLVTLAALLRLWVPGQVIKFPLNEYSVTTLTGTGLTYFNSSSAPHSACRSCFASSMSRTSSRAR